MIKVKIPGNEVSESSVVMLVSHSMIALIDGYLEKRAWGDIHYQKTAVQARLIREHLQVIV